METRGGKKSVYKGLKGGYANMGKKKPQFKKKRWKREDGGGEQSRCAKGADTKGDPMKKGGYDPKGVKKRTPQKQLKASGVFGVGPLNRKRQLKGEKTN